MGVSGPSLLIESTDSMIIIIVNIIYYIYYSICMVTLKESCKIQHRHYAVLTCKNLASIVYVVV